MKSLKLQQGTCLAKMPGCLFANWKPSNGKPIPIRDIGVISVVSSVVLVDLSIPCIVDGDECGYSDVPSIARGPACKASKNTHHSNKVSRL